MKTITITHQEELEKCAIDTMIAFGKELIAEPKMKQAVCLALKCYGNTKGHQDIALKGWIIKTIYALNRTQLQRLESVVFKYVNR